MREQQLSETRNQHTEPAQPDGESVVPPYARGYEGFGGTIGRTMTQSSPWWPEPSRPPSGAPNIVVVVVDDMGFSDTGPYGSEIPTPNIDMLADSGVKFTNFHTTPLCSPSRAALLTGVNPHRAGYGIVANSDPGYPGLRLELPDDVQTLPEALQASGYSTFAVGKWHLVRDSEMAEGGSKKSWPLQRGFDRYYGSLEGMNSFFYPNQLISDNSPVDIDEYPPDYYVTDDLTDKALSMVKSLRAHDAAKPFFLYFAHVAMHGPLQVKDQDLDPQRGRYAAGWDLVRQGRFRRQLELGLFPSGTVPAERNIEPGFDVPEWDDLSESEQQRFARYMEVYAAMVSSVDQSVGRIMDLLDTLEERENTIIVFTSDNGATAEGGAVGTRSYFSQFVHSPVPSDWPRDVPHAEELIGSAKLGVHYPRGWAQVSNAPFRLYKGHSFAGGIRVPFVMSWPRGLPADSSDSAIRTQYAYCTDLTPTLLDLAGIQPPSTRNGMPVQDRDGVSVRAILESRDAPPPRTEQYTEMYGQRGYYRDGWKLLNLHLPNLDVDQPQWQLFNVQDDPCETTDLAAQLPEKVAELADAWDHAAWRNTVFPLATGGAAQAHKPQSDHDLSQPLRILAGTPPLERYRSSKLIQYRDFTIAIDLAGYKMGDEGVLVAHGDTMGGYVLYIEEQSLRFAMNSYGQTTEVDAGLVPVGTGHIRVDAIATADVRWDFQVSIGDRVAGNLTGAPQLIGMAPWTGISIGIDARGPVQWGLRQRRGPFRYRGDLRSVTYIPGQLRVPERTVARLQQESEQQAD